MRDLNYWTTQYIDKGERMPRQFSGYMEEHSAYNQALRIEKHNDFMKKFWPWFWVGCTGAVVFVVLSFIIGFPYVLISTLIIICAILFIAAGLSYPGPGRM